MNQREFDFSTSSVVDAARSAKVAFSSFAAIPAARRGDPETSRIAATLNADSRDTDRRRAFEILAEHPDGLTDYELAERMDRLQTSAGKRRGELMKAGLVQATTIRRPSPVGSPCTVWRVSDEGRRVFLSE